MKPEHRKSFVLSSLILCGTFVCMVFSFRHSHHQSALRLATFVLMLISFWRITQFNVKHRRQPDTLIHLFPNPPENRNDLIS